MAPLTSARNTHQILGGDTLVLPVKGGEIIYDGALVALDANGFAIPGTKAAGLTAAGRAEQYVDNSAGADGDQQIKVSRGVFKWDNDATSPVTAADVLKNCYIVDDQTVTAAALDASVAGKVIGFSNGEVIVETR